jgi:MFS family permease
MTSSPNRWLIAGAGTLVMLCLGTVYSWSLFTQPLVFGLRLSTVSAGWPFAIAIFSLGLGAVVGGRWQDRVGPRTVTLVGILLWGLGNLLAGLGSATFGLPWLIATYGIVAGFGNGMAYITPVATVTKWFPDKRGLASGIVVMGFGLGAFAYNFIVKSLPAYALAAKHASLYADAKAAAAKAGTAFDPTQFPVLASDLSGIFSILLVSGIVFAIVGGLCATQLVNPPAGYQAGGARAAALSHEGSLAPSQVLATPQFYLLWTMLFLNVTAGILIVSSAVPIIRELTGADAKLAATLYAFVAIFNGLGRFFWGAVSDRIGRNAAFTAIFGVQAVVFFLLGGLHSFPLVMGAFAIVLLCYGGGFGTMPSFNADYFGTKYLGINYGMILTAWGTAGLLGPFIGSYFKDATGSYSGALVPVAAMLLIATAIPFITHKPAPKAGGTVAAAV